MKRKTTVGDWLPALSVETERLQDTTLIISKTQRQSSRQPSCVILCPDELTISKRVDRKSFSVYFDTHLVFYLPGHSSPLPDLKSHRYQRLPSRACPFSSHRRLSVSLAPIRSSDVLRLRVWGRYRVGQTPRSQSRQPGTQIHSRAEGCCDPHTKMQPHGLL